MFKTRKREALQFDTPQEMYDDYKKRKINGIQDYQSKVIDIYMEKGIDERDVALELPTGTGKTLVGLLIGEFRRKKNKEKIVYVCPTTQLAYQTANYANEKYGIKVTLFTGSKMNYESQDKLKYTMAESIAVTNYSSIFNINSFFTGAEVLIFDDAHSGENYISANWTVTLERSENREAYWAVFESVKNALTDEQYRLMTKEKPNKEDYSWCDMIHNARLADKYNIIQEILDSKLEESSQRFSWYNIRNSISACNIYITWDSIIIRPYISPTLTNKVFAQAKSRIYMSATLGMSGEMERAYGVEKIFRLPTVKDWSNKDIGRRFFLFPLASFSKEETVHIMCKVAKKANRALILVNDLKTQTGIQSIFKENKIGDTYSGKDIEKSKNEFINKNKAYAVIANRLDGIDFPDDECRTLILFDIPTVAQIQEKFMITRMAAKVLFDERIKTRIIQALGRCTRSQTDFAAVCVLSEEVMTYLLTPKNQEKFNPELQAEIIFGQDNSMDQKDIDDYLEMLNVFYDHGDAWEEAEEGILALRDDIISKSFNDTNNAFEQLNRSAKHEVRLQYALWKQDYEQAIQEVDYVLKQLQDEQLKGYRGYWNYVGGCCAYQLFASGKEIYENEYKNYFKKASESTIAVNWFKYDAGGGSEDEDYSNDILLRIEKMFMKYGNKGVKNFYEFLEEMLRLLELGGVDFERGHERLGTIGGYKATNPKGNAEPDPIWIVNREVCIVAEDKIYEEGKLIPPNDVKEAAGHEKWVRNKADNLDLSKSVKIYTVFITTATEAQENALLYGEDIYYLNKADLQSWAEKLVNIIKEIYRTFPGEGDSKWREYALKIIKDNNLTPRDYLSLISQRKLTDL